MVNTKMVDVKTIEKREKEISDLEKEIINTSYIEYGEAVKKAGSYDKVNEEQINEILDKNKKSYMNVVKPSTVYTTAMAEQAFRNVLSGIEDVFKEIKSPEFLPKLAMSLSGSIREQLNSYKLADVADPKKFAESIEKTYGTALDIQAVTPENIRDIYEQAKQIYNTEVMTNASKKKLGPKRK